MSHTSTVKSVVITSLPALKMAVDELAKEGIKIALQDGGVPRAYYSNQNGLGPADYVLVLGGCPYDVGLYNNGKGGFEARTDLWQGKVAKVLGVPNAKTPEESLGKLFQAYAVNAAIRHATSQGLRYSRSKDAAGNVVLNIVGM